MIGLRLATAACLVAFAGTSQAAPNVRLDITVGPAADYCTMPGMPANCTVPPASATLVSVGPGEDVVVAYTINNIGTVTLNRQDLEDTFLGDILTDFPFTLVPANTAFITQRYAAPAAPGNLQRQARWTARSSSTGESASDVDTYRIRVLQPTFTVRATVAPASAVCGDVDDINTCTRPIPTAIPYVAGRKLVVGFEVTNIGGVTFKRHDLVDPGLGVILADFPFTLIPDATAFILQFDTPPSAVVRTGIWTARTATGYETNAVATYRVSDQLFADGFE